MHGILFVFIVVMKNSNFRLRKLNVDRYLFRDDMKETCFNYWVRIHHLP